MKYDMSTNFAKCLMRTGIGKSMLGYLLLYRWACSGQRVVLHKRGFSDRLLLCSDGAYKLAESAVGHELAREDVM